MESFLAKVPLNLKENKPIFLFFEQYFVIKFHLGSGLLTSDFSLVYWVFSCAGQVRPGHCRLQPGSKEGPEWQARPLSLAPSRARTRLAKLKLQESVPFFHLASFFLSHIAWGGQDFVCSLNRRNILERAPTSNFYLAGQTQQQFIEF